jgi:hypothetical protein
MYNVNDCFEVNFTLATLSEDLSTQNTRSVNPSQSQLQQHSVSITNESLLNESSLSNKNQAAKLPIVSSKSALARVSQTVRIEAEPSNSNTQKSNK